MRSLFITLIFFVTNANANVLQGIDQIDTLNKDLGRVAVLAHHASVDQNNTHLIDLLQAEHNLQLIFAPEHGLRNLEDDFINDGVDPISGLPIISLYQQNRRAPSPQDLAKFDTLIIDLKDVGVRFYTYATTIYLTMKAALSAHKKVILLDRVNPLGGEVFGPVLSPELSGHFISFFEVPQSHGFTICEYMQYVGLKGFECIKLKDWDREMLWSDTGLEWHTPSPALPTYKQAQLYSIFGALESLNISVGRSIDNKYAFRYFGAPWITTEKSFEIAKQLNNLKLKGLYFLPVEWKVTRSLYESKLVRGFEVIITDFSKVKRFEGQYRTILLLLSFFKDHIKFNDWTPRYLGSQYIFKCLSNRVPYHQIEFLIEQQIIEFNEQKSDFLLY